MTGTNLKWSEKLEYHLYKRPKIKRTCKQMLYVLSFPTCCCCCYYLATYTCGGKHRKAMLERVKTLRMASIHFELKGQNVERRQSLSIGSPTTQRTWRRKKKVSDQAASPLFSKLAVELREKIYEYALLDTGAVFCYHDRKYVGSGKVYAEPETESWYGGGRYLPVPKAASCLPTIGGPFEVCPNVRLPKSGAANCSLLRTCRAIYTEALPILYGNTQFVFSSRSALSAFLKTTPITKLQQIRSIRVECFLDWMNTVIDLTRLGFCKNLLTMYMVWHIRHNRVYGSWEYVSGEANRHLEATMKHNSSCVFWCLIYSVERSLEHPRLCPVVHQELQRYKYIDARTDSDWRKSEWQRVE